MSDPQQLTCLEVFNRLDDYLDRNLSDEEVTLVRRHLEDCVVCAGEYRFEATVLDGLKARLRRIDVPPQLLPSILLRLQADSDNQ